MIDCRSGCQNGPCTSGSSPPSTSPPPPSPPPPTPPSGFNYNVNHGEDSRLIAYVGNWQVCPTPGQYDSYSHMVVAFAVSYTWGQTKNTCNTQCTVTSPVHICDNANNQPLVPRHCGSKEMFHLTIIIVITQAIKITAGTTALVRRKNSPQASSLLSIAKSSMVSTSTTNIAMTSLARRQGDARRDQQNTRMSRLRRSSTA